MKLIPPNITPGPWGYYYTSAAQARRNHPGTDGGGASGSIYDKAGRGNVYDRKTIAHLPHHRDISEDTEREANARAISATTDTLAALADLLRIYHGQTTAKDGNELAPFIVDEVLAMEKARAALLKAGYQIEE